MRVRWACSGGWPAGAAAIRGRSAALSANPPRISAAVLAGVAVIAVATAAATIKDPVGKASDQHSLH
ncbi:MAG: hypothetical protein ACRDLL_02090 [Solirubrobacterales bacterium]